MKTFKDLTQNSICELVDPTKPEEIAKKVNELLSDNLKYNLLKKNSNIAFHEKLNFDIQFKKIYSDLLDLEENKISIN